MVTCSRFEDIARYSQREMRAGNSTPPLGLSMWVQSYDGRYSPNKSIVNNLPTRFSASFVVRFLRHD